MIGVIMERKYSFNEIPELYESMRPLYPAAMMDDIQQMSKISPQGTILEIGCGTGQATLPWAKKGYAMTCLDLGDQTIAFVKNKMAAYPKVQFINADFETWDPGDQRFDLIIAGSAFHWINGEIGYPKVARISKPTGSLALFWNMHYTLDTPLYHAIQDVYQAVNPELSKKHYREKMEIRIAKRVKEIDDSGLFQRVQICIYPWEQPYTADEYIQLLGTFSDHIIMEPELKVKLYTGIKETINTHGGVIVRPYHTALYMTQVK
jgi:ubiquinone/menaquinone biosynthesis C-methylase UbiE